MNRANVVIVLAGALALDGGDARAQVEPAWRSLPAAGVFMGAYAGIGTLFQRQDVVLTSTRLLGGRSGAGEGWTFRLWLDGNDERDLPSRVIPIDYCQPLFCPGCSGSSDLALCKLRFGVHPGRVEAMRVAFAEPEAGQEVRILTWQGGLGEKLARTIRLSGPFTYDGFRHAEVLFAQGDQGGPVVDDLDQIVAVNSAARIEMGKEFLYWFGNPVDHVFDLLQWADGRTGFPDSYHCSGVSTIWDLNHDGMVNLFDLVQLSSVYGQTCDALRDVMSRSKCKSIAGELRPSSGEQVNIQFLTGMARYYNQGACRW